MQIITMHTLSFSFRAAGSEQYTAATAIIKRGAESLNVEAKIFNLPLPEGEEVTNRGCSVEVSSLDKDVLENYWNNAERALAFIGVEATSP